MMLKTLQQHVRRAFSNSAIHYEVLSSMQYEIGRELIQALPVQEDAVILDVGMGTGKLANRLSLNYPEARVIGIDAAEGMVTQAAQRYDTFRALQADASHLPFKDQSLNGVVSNCVYQWVDTLPQAFCETRRVLKKRGWFYATLFGKNTLMELFEAIEQSAPVTPGSSLRRLPDLQQVREALAQSGWTNVELRTEITRTHFEDLKDLLLWLKSIGANAMNRDFFLGPRRLQKVAEYYEKKYSGRWGITATFEVIWMKGQYE